MHILYFMSVIVGGGTEDNPGAEWTLHTFYHDIGK